MKWLRDDHDTPHKPIASRLGWLWRLGVVEREHVYDDSGNPVYIAGDPERPKWGQRWRLNELGEAFVQGTLTQRQRETLARLEGEPGKLLMTARWLSELARQRDVPGRQILLREWRYGTSKERNGG